MITLKTIKVRLAFMLLIAIMAFGPLANVQPA